MVHARPFKAIHPNSDVAPRFAALPYDVQSTEEARVIVAANPRSFLAIDEPVVNFPEGTDPASPQVYAKAGELLAEAKADGTLESDYAPHFYLYELTIDGRVQNGIVACVSVDDYLNGTVKKHENTRTVKELDRINHVRACGAQTGPIFTAYHADADLAELCRAVKETPAVFDFVTDDGVRHRGFEFDEADTERITQLLDGLGRVYIADGHHRIAAAAKVAQERRDAGEAGTEADWLLAVLFPDDELSIWPYERVVRDLNGLTPEQFLDELRARFELEPILDANGNPLTVAAAANAAQAELALRPRTKGHFNVYLDGTWYRCTIDPTSIGDDPYDSLDAALLQRLVLEPILAIDDPRNSPRIDFVGGVRGLGELEERCTQDAVAAFALPPTTMAELFAVADADLLMPPKSTWFEPKLRSGLFIHEI